MSKKEYKVSILWGWSHENGDKAKTYKFKTQGELDAFWLGVQDMDGHLGWEVVEEGYVYDEATNGGLGGHRVDREDEYCGACGESLQ